MGRSATASATSPAWETTPRSVAAPIPVIETPPMSTRSEVAEASNQQPKHPPSPLPRNPPSHLLLLVRTSRQQTGAAPNATTRRNAPVRRSVSRNARRPAVSAMMALSTLGQCILLHTLAYSGILWHTIACSGILWHTADGAYHCPVGSIWLFFSSFFWFENSFRCEKCDLFFLLMMLTKILS